MRRFRQTASVLHNPAFAIARKRSAPPEDSCIADSLPDGVSAAGSRAANSCPPLRKPLTRPEQPLTELFVCLREIGDVLAHVFVNFLPCPAPTDGSRPA